MTREAGELIEKTADGGVIPLYMGTELVSAVTVRKITSPEPVITLEYDDAKKKISYTPGQLRQSQFVRATSEGPYQASKRAVFGKRPAARGGYPGD